MANCDEADDEDVATAAEEADGGRVTVGAAELTASVSAEPGEAMRMTTSEVPANYWRLAKQTTAQLNTTVTSARIKLKQMQNEKF